MLLFRFELTCGSSRLWGGVHFVDAVEEGNRIGNEIGKIAANFVRKHINPKNPPVGPVVGPLARQPKSAPMSQRPIDVNLDVTVNGVEVPIPGQNLDQSGDDQPETIKIRRQGNYAWERITRDKTSSSSDYNQHQIVNL